MSSFNYAFMLASHFEVISIMMNHSQTLNYLCCIFFTVSPTFAFPQQLADCFEYDRCIGRFGWENLVVFVDINILTYLKKRLRHIWSCEQVWYFLIYIQELVDPRYYLEISFKELVYCKNKHRIVMCLPCLFLFSFSDLIWIIQNHPAATIALPINSNFTFRLSLHLL